MKAVDFLHPATAPRVGWWLLAAGVLAMGAAKWYDQHLLKERLLADRVEQSRAEAYRAAQKAEAPRALSTADRRLQRAQAELRRPWIASLRAIESAAVDPVYLLSISFEPAVGGIQLEAVAPGFEQALAFTHVLAEGAALSSVTLASHEQTTEVAAVSSMVRFTVLTRWNAP